MMTKKLTILLVEDDEGHALLIEETLRQSVPVQGIIRAKDGEEAMTLLEKAKPLPDLILLDLKLPRVEGHVVLNQIKTNDRTRSIPVVIISSTSDPKEIDYSYKLGVAGYIVKPVDYKELEEKIDGLGRFLKAIALPQREGGNHANLVV